MVPLPSPCQKHRFFSWYSLWEPGRATGDKTQKSVCGGVQSLGSPGVFSDIHTQPSAICQLVIQFFLPQHCGRFSLWVSALVRLCSVSFSNCSSSLPCDFISLTDLRVNFSVCSAFYLGGRGDFQANVLDWKLKVYTESLNLGITAICIVMCYYLETWNIPPLI